MENLTPTSMRAARGILKWSIRDLADHAGIAPTTVHQAESGSRALQSATAAKIVEAFTAAGVELLPPPGDGARRIAAEA